jgi:two-component system response regulator HupR/HoxA
MPLAMQAKLLRVVQENEVTSVGDTRPSKVDVRVISATNRDLKEAQAARAFRPDLFYRLAAFPIRLPPLRERREDIPFLAARLLEQASERHNKKLGGFEPSAIELLDRAEWPGNVRELQNEIERAVALARGGETLTTAHFSQVLAPSEAPSPGPAVVFDGIPAAAPQSTERGSAERSPAGSKISLQNARDAYEAKYITQVLAEHGGNVSHAAVALRLSRVALQKKMKRYGLR